MVDKSLLLSNGNNLEFLDKNPKFFLNETIILYGKRKSGKSVIMKEIIYLLRDYISIPIMVMGRPSDDFLGVIPSFLIKREREVNKEWFEQFLKTQGNRALMYKTANNIKNIKKVFDKLKNSRMEHYERDIINSSNQKIDKIMNSTNLDYAEKIELKKKIQELNDYYLMQHYKKEIRSSRLIIAQLKKQKKLDTTDICVIDYMDFNPHALLVLEDCAAKIKEWCKQSTTIKEIFFNGRHYYITIMITSQTGASIDKDLRENVGVNIFTTAEALERLFDLSKPPKFIKEGGKKASERVFKNDNIHIKNYKKLIYHTDDNKFYYTIAQMYENFRIGSSYLWDMEKEIQEKRKRENGLENNIFFSKYLN